MSENPKSVVPQSSGDSFHFEGNFTGANINIKNFMRDVRQQISYSSTLDDQSKTVLEELIGKLEVVLG